MLLDNCCIGDEGMEALAETQAENLKSLDLCTYVLISA